MRVAHYLERWLELSAGFVAAQIQRSRYPSVVISRDGWENLDAFPHRPRHSLHRLRERAPEPLKYPLLRSQLAPLLTMHRTPLVHVHFGYAAADVADVLSRRRYVLSLHGHDVTGLLHDQPPHYERVVGAVDAVIVPSRFLASAAERAGFSSELVHVIPSGVDTSFFTPSAPPEGPPTVTFVGRLVEKKGIDVLLDAWPMVTAEVPDAGLRILGDGPLASLLTNPPTSVRHLLPQPARRHEQVREELRRANVVVTPSRTGRTGDAESLLLVNLEAGASARPVVSTQHGGIPEYVEDGRTGLLVPEGDAAALAAAIVRLIRDPALATSLADAAVEHVAQWDIGRCAARVDEVYDSLLRR